RRQPLVGRLAAGRRGRGVLGLVAALGQALLGPRGARLRSADLGFEPRRPARLLVALGLGRLAPATRGLGLAAQVLDAGELALQAALAGLDVARLAIGVAGAGEQRRVGDLGRGEEALPRPE